MKIYYVTRKRTVLDTYRVVTSDEDRALFLSDHYLDFIPVLKEGESVRVMDYGKPYTFQSLEMYRPEDGVVYVEEDPNG